MKARAPVLFASLCAILAPTAPALGGDDDAALPFRFRFADGQPAEGQPPADNQPPPPPDKPRPYGAAETRWWTVGGGVAHDFNGSTDSELLFSYSYFLAEDVEFGAEAGGWYFNQTGDNTVGGSLSMLFRWHFVNSGPWTVYADLGIGFLIAGDVVPEGGTSFDLLPRAGVGFTRALTESNEGSRLQVGLRWHHVSNARIFGESNNPARDQPMLYVGFIFPF